MLRIAICDDNRIQREMMADVLAEFSSTHSPVEVTAFSSGEELITASRAAGGFDVYLLDVMMPGYNGMETAATLRQLKDRGHIIFITASLDYAAQSYDVEATYYLVKPVDVSKLYRVLDKIAAEKAAEERHPAVEVAGKHGTVHLRLDDLLYIDLVNRAPVYHRTDGSVIETRALRGTFREAVAPVLREEGFAFAGVSLVVNLRHIDAMDSESILLDDGTQLYPPRSACAELRRAWKSVSGDGSN